MEAGCRDEREDREGRRKEGREAEIIERPLLSILKYRKFQQLFSGFTRDAINSGSVSSPIDAKLTELSETAIFRLSLVRC